MLGEGGELEGVSRDGEFADHVLLHPGQPLLLLHAERDSPLLLRGEPGREAFLDLVAERDELIVLMQRVPYQRDDVSEGPVAGATDLALVQQFIRAPQRIERPLAR